MAGEWTERDGFTSAIHLLNNRRQMVLLEADRPGLPAATVEALDAGYAALTAAVSHLRRRLAALPRDVFGAGAAG